LDCEPSGYAENPDNVIFSLKKSLSWQVEVGKISTNRRLGSL